MVDIGYALYRAFASSGWDLLIADQGLYIHFGPSSYSILHHIADLLIRVEKLFV